MEALGIPRGSYVVKVNNRKVLDGVMEATEIPAEKHLAVLRAIDKLDRLGIDGVRMLLGAGRKDESGDFTKGAQLTEPQCSQVLEAIKSGVSGDIGGFEGVMTVVTSSEGQIPPGEKLRQAGMIELSEIQKLVRSAGYDRDRIRVDPSVVRGLEYYTGPVYEVELLIETKDDKSRPVRFGSVGGGGRYDGLVSRFMGQPVPATGFSIGVSRLMAALTTIGKLGGTRQAGPVLVTVFGADSVPACQGLVAKLRNAGIRAELYLGNPKHGIGQQLKYADKRNAPCAVIQGPDEKAKGEVQLRDLIAGSAPSDIKDRDEYLKKQAEAQVAVKESELVDAVRTLLARHKLG
jgi:histidyl-tRNA synthetase